MDELRPDAVCDGGDLDCGSGLLLILRNALAPLASTASRTILAVSTPPWQVISTTSSRV